MFLSKYLEELQDETKSIVASRLINLSGLSRQESEVFQRVWTNIKVSRPDDRSSSSCWNWVKTTSTSILPGFSASVSSTLRPPSAKRPSPAFGSARSAPS